MGRRQLGIAARILIWVVVGGGVVLLAKRLDWDDVFSAFSKADLRFAALAAALGLAAIVAQGLRWAQLVRALSPVSYLTTVCAMASGQAASIFLPMRAGDAVRTELLARRTGVGRSAIVGTVAADAAINALVMFVLAAALPLMLPVPRWLAYIFWAGCVVMAALLGVLMRLSKHPEKVHSGKLLQILARLRGGLVALRDPAHVVPAVAFSLLGWAIEIGIGMLALDAFGLAHDAAHSMAVLFGVNLALAIPAPPGGLGTFELGAGMALVAFGGDKERATAFAIGYHALQLLPQLLLGGLLVTHFRRRDPRELQPA